ncbi:MAG: asparagine synthase (glutamine-hydrolyzing) [Verrucomicrobiota bacterium]|nr:asparagine synthase (glutamine-hydrolyzing) [Verrucomicrobiota bacterium]
MCGIAGEINLRLGPVRALRSDLEVMNRLQQHRGPDGEGIWVHPRGCLGFGHRRLSIIDLATGAQPMTDGQGNWVTHNGEIYNFEALRRELGERLFSTRSDTEVILMAYRKWGEDCVARFRGMFAFALWDEARQALFCARDRFGIKPFCYTVREDAFFFASEAKALLPFLPDVETDVEGLKDYLTFQFCLAGKTLFRGVQELLPGHVLTVAGGTVRTRRYWEVQYDIDFGMDERAAEARLRAGVEESVQMHLRSDVPLGAYLSGGLDSSIVCSVARQRGAAAFPVFTGRFPGYPEYDESRYAGALADARGLEFCPVDLGAEDFIRRLPALVRALDYPTAGAGSFPQFMVSAFARRHRKVVLGGQGGDEVFGGYTRYLIAYFEQCIKAAIEGTMRDGRFVVTYESIIPNLVALRKYKPALQEFWREGLFEDMDRRYFRLVNRASGFHGEVRWELLGDYSPFEAFRAIFHGPNVRKESYFDLMTHFDFKTLLPALLHVEDRVSMAHGIESRAPLLDHPLVEFAATIPANIKFKDGNLKHVLRGAFVGQIPALVAQRQDKMGFPVPFTEWSRGPAREFVVDTLSSDRARGRPLVDNAKVVENLDREPRFGRRLWGLLCLELWQQEFHDRRHEFRRPAPGDAGDSVPGVPRG